MLPISLNTDGQDPGKIQEFLKMQMDVAGIFSEKNLNLSIYCSCRILPFLLRKGWSDCP